MNHLAHALLSFQNKPILVGNYIADFIKPMEVKKLPKNIWNGIALHREIDFYTDHHPIVKDINTFIRRQQGKYAPVITDILFDYILIKKWSAYGPTDLDTFTINSYNAIREHISILPPRITPKIESMLAYDFLKACSSKQHLEKTFSFLQNRVSFDNNIDQVIDHLQMYEAHIFPQFDAFFIALHDFAFNVYQSQKP